MGLYKVRTRGQVTTLLVGASLILLFYFNPTGPPKQSARAVAQSQTQQERAPDEDLAEGAPPGRNRSSLRTLTLAEQEAYYHPHRTPKKPPERVSGFSVALGFFKKMLSRPEKGSDFLGSLKNAFKLGDYAKQFKDGWDEIFYTIKPPTVGVPEITQAPDSPVPKDLQQEFEPGPPAPPSASSDFSLPSCACVRHIPARNASGYVTLWRWAEGQLRSRRLERSSNCNDYATSRGPGQKVVTYSYFGNTEDPGIHHRYFSEIPNRAAEVMDKYPGWVMRVYHNVSEVDLEGQKVLCSAFCKYPHLDFCHVDDLPSPFQDFGHQQEVGTLWRFLAALDPLVDVFISRDLDSYILPREQAAVRQWLGTEYPYHLMRDHPLHASLILAGLWGCRVAMDRANAYHLLSTVVSQPRQDHWDYDQRLLRRIVWPGIKGKVVGHDSYFCHDKMIEGKQVSLPFPVQRNGLQYTGYGRTKDGVLKLVKPCPLQCRPKDHRDWLYC